LFTITQRVSLFSARISYHNLPEGIINAPACTDNYVVVVELRAKN